MEKGGCHFKYIVVLIILMMAAIQDYRCSKVSNIFIFLGYSISFVYQCTNRNGHMWFLGVIVPVLSLFSLFYLKMLGAADIKLISVLGGFYGWAFSLRIFAVSLVYGALWSLGKLFKYHNLNKRLAFLMEYLKSIMVLKQRIPYLKEDSAKASYTIPYSVVILLAYITEVLVQHLL